MAPMENSNPLSVCRDVAAGFDCLGVLAIRHGYDPINRAARDGLLIIAPRVTLTKWGARLVRDAELDCNMF